MNRLIKVKGGGTQSMNFLLQNSLPANTGMNLQEDTVVFLVDTSGGATNLILPEGIGQINISMKFFIVDQNGNAVASPITVSAASTSDLVNGGASVSVSTAFGSAWVTGAGGPTPASFRWIASFGGAASSNTGGVSGISALTNGLTLTGTTGYLGGTLIQDTTINGLDTTSMNFSNADLTFILQFGKLGANTKSYQLGSVTGNQKFSEQITIDDQYKLSNIDIVSSINRTITLISTSAGLSGTPTGAIVLTEAYSSGGNGSYNVQISTRSISMYIANVAVTQNPVASLVLNDTSIVAYKFISNTDTSGVQNGWNINTSPDNVTINWHGSLANAYAGNTFQLDTNGISLYVGGSSIGFRKFNVSPAGVINAPGTPTSDPHVVGAIYSLGVGGPLQISNG